jgi:hypothetical protein
MYSLILKIAHNLAVKDSIAVVRGVYRIAETLLPTTSHRNRRTNSWMDDPIEASIGK